MKSTIIIHLPNDAAMRYRGNVDTKKMRSRSAMRLSQTQAEIAAKGTARAPVIDLKDTFAFQAANELASAKAKEKGFKVYVEPFGYLTNSEIMAIAMQVGAQVATH